MSTLLEYWGLFLARWLNEAAHAGRSNVGGASDLFKSCDVALDPKPRSLLRRFAKDGFARRRDINKMVGQCLRKHGLWSALAPSGIAHAAEFNAQGWNALHFAASFGNVEVLEDMLSIARGPDEAEQIAAIKNGHHTPLQTAIIHSEVEAVAVLAGYTGGINHASNVRLVRQTAATRAAARSARAPRERRQDREGVRRDATRAREARQRSARAAPRPKAAPDRGRKADGLRL